MKKIKLFGLIVGLSLVLIACQAKTNEEKTEKTTNEKVETTNTEKEEKNTTEKVENTENSKSSEFSNIDNGGFYVNNKGVAVSPDEVKGKKVVDWYFEPLCPGCVILEQDAKNYLKEIQGENTFIKYYPISFLGKKEGQPDFVTYSDKMVGIMLSIAQHDPELAHQYIQNVMDETFITLNYKKEDQIPAFKQAYEDLGGKKWDEIVADMEKCLEMAQKTITDLKANEELKNKIPDKRLATPLLYVNGADSTLVIDTEKPETIRPILEEALK